MAEEWMAGAESQVGLCACSGGLLPGCKADPLSHRALTDKLAGVTWGKLFSIALRLSKLLSSLVRLVGLIPADRAYG